MVNPLGVYNGKNYFGLGGAGYYVYGRTGWYNNTVGQAPTGNYFPTGSGTSIVLTSDGTKSGIVCKMTIPAKNTPSSSLSTQKLGQWAIKYM